MQNQQTDWNVKYFRVEPDIYRAVVAFLGKLPFEQVVNYLKALTNGTTAIFTDSEPDSANRSLTDSILALREQVETIIAEEADSDVVH